VAMHFMIRHVTYPLFQAWKGNPSLGHLRALTKSERIPPKALREHRLRKLERLVRHAYQNVPFYRRRFDEAGLHPDQIRDFADLRRLPILTKSDIIGNLENLVATNLRPDEVHRSATGGSTGERTPFYRDNRCMSTKKAVELRFNRWTGWDVGEWIANVWPSIQDFAGGETFRGRVRNALVDRTLMLYSGKLDEQVLASHARRLREVRPSLIRAFSNPLNILAKYLKEEAGAPIRPKAVISTGEPLLPGQRTLFEDVFDCPVFNLYASRENGHMACECEAHSCLHIAAEALHLEFVHDGEPARAGQPGHILVTDLENLGMPFLRYEIQDVGVAIDGACSCGRTLPLMSFEAGRISDFLVSPHDGTLVSGSSLCHYLIAEGPDVGQVQIIQDQTDHLTIKIRRSPGFHEGETGQIEGFEKTLRKIFKHRMRASIVFVDSIPHERSGKYRFCVNQVAPGEHANPEVSPKN